MKGIEDHRFVNAGVSGWCYRGAIICVLIVIGLVSHELLAVTLAQL
jgi:hypothetical protein